MNLRYDQELERYIDIDKELLDNPPFGHQCSDVEAKDLAIDHFNRKSMPVYSGVLNYFPDALKEVSKASKAGNDQHHPDKALHWDKSKSTEDDDGVMHLAKVAWRALASLQIYLENN